MKNMLRKDFFREIRRNKGRFISIFFIVLLGTAFFSGIRSANYDMKYTADKYYDESELMDIRVVGTMGLTDADIEDIRALPGVETAVGGYTQEVLCGVNEDELVLQMIACTDEINRITVEEGRLPEKADECLADTVLMERMGCQIGDTITVSSGTEDELSDSLSEDTYTIVGVGYLPYYMDLTRGSGTIGDGTIDAFLVVPPEAFCLDVYTEAYVRLTDTAALLSYSDAYDEAADAAVKEIEAVGETASERRYEEVRSEAEQELEDARAEVADAEQELEDARQELEDGRKELEDGEQELLDAEQELKDGEQELADGEKELADAEQQVADAEQELADGRKELEDGERELADARAQIEDGERQIQEGWATIADQEEELNANRAQYESGLAMYQQGEQQYAAGEEAYNAGVQALQTYQDGMAKFQEQGQDPQTLVAQYTELEQQRAQMELELQEAGLNPEENEEYLALKGMCEQLQPVAGEAEKLIALGQNLEENNINAETLEESKKTLEETRKNLDSLKQSLSDFESGEAQLAAAKAELESKSAELESGKAELAAGEQELADARAQIEDGQRELEDGRAELESARQELEDGRKELEDGRQELEDGRRELEENRQKLEDGEKEYQEEYAKAQPELEDARQQIEDGQKELDDLEEPEWYVLDRSMIASCATFEQDAERIKNVGEVFPVMFFLVAALVSLTAMTRMIEEQRLQIGTLKALGYRDGAIAVKYFSYAMLATVSGGICGVLIGEKALPYVIMDAYGMLYTGLPEYLTPINWDQGIFAILAAVASTGVATLAACYRELRARPAELMRPEAPKNGKRVFLERITILWKRLNFTQKSTLRNLIRYKKRFFMTIIGIGGCMALMLVGFGLEDSITEIAKRQYVEIFTYDASVTLDTKAANGEKSEFRDLVSGYDGVTDTEEIYLMNVDLKNGDEVRSAYLFVPEDTEQVEDFLVLRDRVSREGYDYPEKGAALAEKTAKLLNVSVGDTIQIQKGEDEPAVSVEVTEIVENYVQHYAFLSPETYRELFGEEPEYNCLYVNTDDQSEKYEEQLAQELMKQEVCSGVSFVTDLEQDIDDMLEALNIVIYVLILSAGLLAFVVLYNLNSINITERQRELATLKVLGFYDGEVAMYVYRENVLLTVIGILVGALLGAFLHQFIILTVEVDLMMFGRVIGARSYILSGLITLLFSVAVNLVMYFRLKKINMIESLKSVE
jgi:putative ABC transport system permease protein